MSSKLFWLIGRHSMRLIQQFPVGSAHQIGSYVFLKLREGTQVFELPGEADCVYESLKRVARGGINHFTLYLQKHSVREKKKRSRLNIISERAVSRIEAGGSVSEVVMGMVGFRRYPSCSVIVEDVASALISSEDTRKKIGENLDDLLLAINAEGILDVYMGAELEEESQTIRLFFSDTIDEAAVQAFLQTISNTGEEIDYSSTEDHDAKWVVTIRYPLEVTPGEVDGGNVVGRSVELSGDLGEE